MSGIRGASTRRRRRREEGTSIPGVRAGRRVSTTPSSSFKTRKTRRAHRLSDAEGRARDERVSIVVEVTGPVLCLTGFSA